VSLLIGFPDIQGASSKKFTHKSLSLMVNMEKCAVLIWGGGEVEPDFNQILLGNSPPSLYCCSSPDYNHSHLIGSDFLEVKADQRFIVKQHLGFDIQEFNAFIKEDDSIVPQIIAPPVILAPDGSETSRVMDMREKAGLLAEIDLRLILKKPAEVWEKWPKQVNNAMMSIQIALQSLNVELPKDTKSEDMRSHQIKVEVLIFFLSFEKNGSSMFKSRAKSLSGSRRASSRL